MSSDLITSTLLGRFEVSSHRWVQATNIHVTGSGSASILICFGALIKNLTIHIQDGHLFLLIGPHSSIENTTIQSQGYNNAVYIGVHVSANGLSLLTQGAKNYTYIGHDCMFSTGIHIRNSDSHSIYSYETRQRINPDSPVIIGDHCWIGRNVTIGKGVRICDDIIVGQASLVATSLLSSHSVYGGVPSRLIKNDTTWDRSRSIVPNEIQETMAHRPKQLMCNSFLQTCKPTLPVPHAHDLDELHRKHIIAKDYRWMDALFSHASQA